MFIVTDRETNQPMVPKSYIYQFMTTLDLRGQGIQNDGNYKRGEKGLAM